MDFTILQMTRGNADRNVETRHATGLARSFSFGRRVGESLLGSTVLYVKGFVAGCPLKDLGLRLQNQIMICLTAEIYCRYTYIGKKFRVIGSFFLVTR